MSKHINKMRKALLQYHSKYNEWAEVVSFDRISGQVTNRKEISGKLAAAKRFYNIAMAIKIEHNISDSIWVAHLNDTMIESKKSSKKVVEKFGSLS